MKKEMKSIGILCVMLIVCASVCLAPISESVNIDVSLINQDPDPAEPGKYVERITQINTISSSSVQKGGIGVIDCESFRVTKPNSIDVKKDVEKFKNRLLKKFNQNINEEFYMKGMQNAQKIFKGISVAKKVKDETIKKYNNIFYPIKNFDFDTRKLTYK